MSCHVKVLGYPKITSRLEPTPQARLEPARAQAKLSKTASESALGPDRINYRLLKLISSTPLGEAVIDDIAITCEGGRTLDEYRDLKVMMVPKPGKPANLV